MNGHAETDRILGGGVMEVGENLLEPIRYWADSYAFRAA